MKKGVSMQTVATACADRTFGYTQIERQGDLAIYAQTHKEGGQARYEVVIIRVRAAHTWPNGDTTPEHEAYPGANAWGRDGWTFFTLPAAQAHAEALARQKETRAPLDMIAGEERGDIASHTDGPV